VSSAVSLLYPPCQLCYNAHRAHEIFAGAHALNPTASASLLPAFESQDEVFSSAFSILRQAITDHAFPAASIAVTHAGKLIALKSFGRFTHEGNPEGGDFDSDVTPATLFDLASLTKVVATTTMAMILYERGLLELDAPVAGVVPEFLTCSAGPLDPRRRNVTFRMLLAHSSGLPAYEKLFLKAHTRDELLRVAFATPLSADPGSRAVYSDIGFIILGAALERLAEDPLDRFCQREIFGPLAMTHTSFNPPAEIRSQIPPTADDTAFRNRIIQGEVQDENAFVLGGVAGHAGLFSSAEDLARFAHAMLQCGAGTPLDSLRSLRAGSAREMPAAPASSSASPKTASIFTPILHPETLSLFTRHESVPAGTSRALGWDTPSSPSQSGKYFSSSSFGHLGYTGTSLWIDPVRQLSITLLTNRTWPDCASQAIKQVRPKFHDAVVEALLDSA